MGRVKSNSGGSGVTSSVTSERVPPVTTASGTATNSSSSVHLGASSSSSALSLNSLQTVDLKLRDSLRELYFLIHQVQEERARGEHNLIVSFQEERSRGENNLSNITKTHERMQLEQKISPYYKSKLRGLYNTAMQDAESESQLLRKALDKIAEIKSLQEQGKVHRPKQIMRRGVLMNMLQQNAISLPLWIGKPGERPPPLCGAISAEPNYIAKPSDKVAARVRSADGEENWILAEVVAYNSNACRYEVDDVDAEEGKERHTLSRRRIVPLPIWKVSPETDSEALFPKGALVLALYPQTTCFYRALVHEPPEQTSSDYSVLFEDTSYPEGYSPPLSVAQRYVISCRDDRKK